MEHSAPKDAATMLRSTFKWPWGKPNDEPSIIQQEREATQDETRGGSDGIENECSESRVGAETVMVKNCKKNNTEQKEIECDSDMNPTEIYLSLLKREWTKTITRAESNPEEVKTWVSRSEDDGSIRWQLLPIHAAMIFKAPDTVVHALLDAYPAAAKQADDQGMLPLHLAFHNDASEHTVSILLQAYPGAVTVKDREGRTPLAMAQASKSAIRGVYMQLLSTMSSVSSVSDTDTGNEALSLEQNETTLSEQPALIDATVIELSKTHRKEMGALESRVHTKTKETDFVVDNLKGEFAKDESKSAVLAEYGQDLEDLTNLSNERKALIDSKIRELPCSTDQVEASLKVENKLLRVENVELQVSLKQMCRDLQEANKRMEEMKSGFDDRLQAWVRRCMRLEDENKKMQSECESDLRAENEALQKERADLEAKFHDYERRQVSAASEQIDDLEKNYEKRMVEWKQKATEEKKVLETELEEWKSKAAEWRSKATELESNQAKAEPNGVGVDGKSAGDASSLERKVHEVEAKPESRQNSLGILQLQLLEANREIIDLTAKMAREERKREESEALYEARVTALMGEKLALLMELEGVQSSSSDHCKSKSKGLWLQVMTLEAERTSKKQIESSLKAECSVLLEENASLQSTLDAAREERDSHCQQIEKLKSKVDEMNKDLVSASLRFQTEVRASTDDRDISRTEVIRLQKDNESLDSAILELKGRYATAAGQIEDMLKNETKHKNLRVRLITLEAEAQSRSHTETLLRTECASLREEKVSLQVNLELFENKYGEARRELEELKSCTQHELNNLQGEKESFARTLKLLKAKYEGALERAASIEKNIKEERKALKEENEILQHALALAEAKHEAATNYLDEMEADLTCNLMKVREEKEKLKNALEMAELNTREARNNWVEMEVSLREELDDLRKENVNVQADLDQAIRKIATAERQRASIEMALQHAEESHDDTKKEFDEIEATWNAKLTAAYEESRGLSTTVQKANREIEGLERQGASLQSALEYAEATQDDLRRQLTDVEALLTHEINGLREENAILTSDLERASQKNEEVEENKESLRRALEDVKRKLEEFKIERNELKETLGGQIECLRENKQQFESALEQKQMIIAKLTQQLDEIEEDAKSENARLWEENEALKELLDLAEDVQDRMQTELAGKTNDFKVCRAQMQEEKEQWVATLLVAETRIKEIWEQYDALKAESTAQIDSLDTKKRVLETRFNHLEMDYKVANKELQDQKEALREREVECIGLSDSVTQLTYKLEKLTDEFRKAQDEWSSTKCDNKTEQQILSTKIEDLEAEIKRLKNSVIKLKESNDKLREDKRCLIKDNARDLQERARELRNFEAENVEAHKEIKALKDEREMKHNVMSLKIAELLDEIKDKGAIEKTLRGKLYQIEQEVAYLQHNLETCEADLDLAIKNLESMEVDFDSTVNELRHENEKLQDSICIAESKQLEAAKHLEHLEGTLRADNEALWSENDTLKDAVIDAEAKHREAIEQIEQVEGSLNQEIIALIKEKESLKEQLKNFESKYEESIESSKGTKHELESERAVLLREQHILRERLAISEGRNASSLRQLDEMEENLVDELEGLQKENRNLLARLVQAENEVSSFTMVIAALNDLKEKEIEEIRKEQKCLESELAQAEVKCQETLNTLEEMETSLGSEIIMLKEEKSSVEETLESTQGMYKEDSEMFNRIIEDLKAENTDLNKQIKFLQESVNNTTRDLEKVRKQSEENEDELQQELINLNDERERMESELTLAKIRQEGTLRQLHDMELALSAKHAALKRDNGSLKKELEVASANYNAAFKQVEEMKELYENQLKELRLVVAKFKLDMKNNKEIESLLKAKNKSLQDAMKSLQVDLKLAHVKQEVEGSHFEETKELCHEELQRIRVPVFNMEEENKNKKKMESCPRTGNTRLRDDVELSTAKLEEVQSKYDQIHKEYTALKLEHISCATEAEKYHLSDFESLLGSHITVLESERISLLADLESSQKEPEEGEAELKEKQGNKTASHLDEKTVKSLQKELETVQSNYEAASKQLDEMKNNHDKLRKWSFTLMKHGKENSSMKAEWASAQARAALAEAQLKLVKDERDELSSFMSKSKVNIEHRKQTLEETVQRLSDGLLAVAKLVDEMAEQQQKIVLEASKLEEEMMRASEAQDILQEAFFSKASKSSKRMATMLRHQGHKFAMHMNAYQSLLVQWSESVTPFVVTSMDLDFNEAIKTMEAVEALAMSGEVLVSAKDKKSKSETRDVNKDRDTSGIIPESVETLRFEVQPRQKFGTEEIEVNEGKASSNFRKTDQGAYLTDKASSRDKDCSDDKFDDGSAENEQRTGVILLEDGIEMFHNPYTME